MGLFDKVKKNAKEISGEETKVAREIPLLSKSGFIATDGYEIVEYNYIDLESAFRKPYDTIRLVVKKQEALVDGKDVAYNALVSWYGQNDAVDPAKENRVDQLVRVQLGIDFKKMESDKEYQKVVMTELLEKTRVEVFMEDGLKENPFTKCGNYLGQVAMDKNTKKYKPFYNKRLGEMSHNSKYQVKMREKHRRELAEKNMRLINRGIANKKKQDENDLE